MTGSTPLPRRALLGLVALFVLLVGLELHGFSLAVWSDHLETGGGRASVLLGTPRAIRSDDWKVQLPLAFAQAAHDPAFPVVNRNVGLGQNMLLPIPLPVAHVVTAFRPTLWGFWIGNDVGLAWMWWARVLGLLAVWWAVFHVVARGRTGLALAGALFVAASPFFQFWSFNAAPHATAMGLCFLASVALARARTRRRIAGSALVLAWAGGWLVLAIYPPYQVALAYLYLALLAGWLWSERATLSLRTHGGWRLGGLVLAALLVACAVLVFLADAREAVALMRHTDYPGERIATGGDRPSWALLNANLATGLFAEDYGPLHNVCEAAGFWLWLPVVAGVWLGAHLARTRRIDPLGWALLAYAGIVFTYCTLGFPEWLARGTGFHLMPGKRAVLGLGLADAALLLRFVSHGDALRERRGAVAAAVALGWSLVLAATALRLARELPGIALPPLLAAALVNGGLAWLLLRARRPALPVLLLALACLATSVWFNPLARGGAALLTESPVARRVRAIDEREGGGTQWLVFGGDELANVLRTVGVRTLNGTQTLPQLALWQRLDPSGRYRSVYNRYAHVAFTASVSTEPRFVLRSQDFVIVHVRPDAATLGALGATHVLLRAPDRFSFERLADVEHLGSEGSIHFYRVAAPAPTAP